ncbi:hypothetical protein MMC34_004359 [Xylographa carneopallida]|nr:hypothetical protein [Xylographa carneopallida]
MDVIADFQANANSILISGGLFMGLATLAVGLRLYTRPLLKLRFEADDWCIIVALLLLCTAQGLEYAAIVLSRQVTGLLDPKMSSFLFYLYVYGIFYYPAIAMTNISILCLYRRIFTTPYFRKLSLGLIAANVIWVVPATLVEIFICTPVRSFWDFTVQGSCIFFSTFWIVICTVELVLDVAILVLPVGEISHLQLSLKKKILLSFIFLLGGFVIITGIVRIIQCYEPGLSDINLIQDAIWLNIHLSTAIICACLPTYRPLLTSGLSALGTLRKSYGGSSASSKSAPSHRNEKFGTGASEYSAYREIEDRKAWSSAKVSRGSDTDEEYPLRGIGMKQSVSVV